MTPMQPHFATAPRYPTFERAVQGSSSFQITVCQMFGLSCALQLAASNQLRCHHVINTADWPHPSPGKPKHRGSHRFLTAMATKWSF
mgnify:CR=1 FL=1